MAVNNSPDHYPLYLERLEKTRNAMRATDTPVLLILDPINVLYATGASNMTIFSIRTPARYLLLFADGPVILFDFFGCEHLSADLPTIDEIRPARGLCFTSSNGQVEINAGLLAKEINGIIVEHLGNENRLAIDRFPFAVVDALRQEGHQLSDADAVLYQARKTKTKMEIGVMREAMQRVEHAVSQMQDTLRPGITENEAWGNFQQDLIRQEGRYVTTRLMQSGSNTFPYFQESSTRTMQNGDLVCLDTDALGYLGYAVDFSRTFVCGDTAPSDAQKSLYSLAREQLEHNSTLIQPGAAYREIAEKAWPVPEDNQDSRYYCIAHGLGMSGELPNILHAVKGEPYPLTGEVEPGMVLCVESYIGDKRYDQGVKLEQQLLVTDNGNICLSQYPFDERLGG